MSQANELLDNLSTDGEVVNDGVTEEHIVIGSDRFITVPASLRRIAVQYDHNVETVTFDCPRYWDGLDMSTMGIHINYLLSNGQTGQYVVDSVVADGDIMHFDWVIDSGVTEVAGYLSFLVCIVSEDSEGTVINHWNSELNRDLYVSVGLDAVPSVSEQYPDVITQLLTRMSTLEADAMTKAYVDKDYVERIKTTANDAMEHASTALANSEMNQEDISELQTKMGGVANALIGEKSGNSITFDDISPVPSTVKVSVESKNLVPLDYRSAKRGESMTTRGITFTVNDDGTITMNGTHDGTGNVSFFLVNSTTDPFVLPKGTYIGKTGLDYIDFGHMTVEGKYGNFNSPKILEEETKFRYMYLSMTQNKINGKTFNGETVYPMLMRGTVCENYVEPVASGTSVTLSRDGQEISTAVGETVEFGEGVDYGVIEQGSSIDSDNEGVALHAEYNRDINIAFAELQQAIISLGGNV